ncbi:MAG TPA: tetratricopeptide repeat protein [Kofleriaceae bacterium]|nr:tetratricopeptide repeat protein [Kofleriaceae bacterium]
MIEATCAACGTVNRIAEGDVPAGAKSVTCTSCKARIALPAAKGFAIPSIPKPGSPAAKAPSPLAARSATKPKRAETGPLADLPAPKRASPFAGIEATKPSPRSGLEVADLPTPKAGAQRPVDLDDWSESDLLAPKVKNPLDDLPTPKIDPLDNLPVPKAGARSAPSSVRSALQDADLVAPKGKSKSQTPALGARAIAPTPPKPAPVAPAPAPLELDPLADLPAPKVGLSDLPAPKPGSNLDLPAPKGFFDDLPQPARRQPPGGGGPDLLAPKGFFDDLPQPANKASRAPDLLAPKGFFDDLPQPAKPNAPSPPAPKGFFDDLPQPAKPNLPTPVVGTSSGNVFDDLPDPNVRELSSADLDLGPATAGGVQPLDLEAGLDSGPELDLGLPPEPKGAKSPPLQPPSDFNDLDLSSPTLPPTSAAKAGINIKTPAGSSSSPAVGRTSTSSAFPPRGGEMKLDLEDETAASSIPGVPQASSPVAQLAKQKRQEKAEATAEAKAKQQRRTRIVLGAMLGVAIAGAGGSFFYKRHHDAQVRAEEIQEHLAEAHKAIHQGSVGHWTRAANEATEVLSRDEHNVDALGVRAEALLGGYLDTGIGGDTRVAMGKKVLADALEAGITGPQLDAAQALGMIAAHQSDRAVTKLQTMVQRDPKNGFWQLYLGWALTSKGDPAGAVKAFDAAIAADPTVKLPALYARGRAKIQLLDLEGAKADFAAVLDIKKDHIGAQVGLAAALPASQAAQRETDLLAILARKDIAGGDPRAVVQAWALAADTARANGRLDVARDRYQKALALSKTDAPALVGLAQVEIADGKLDVASDLVQKALAQSPDNANAQLAAADLDVKQGKLDDALAIEQKLAGHQPPLPPLLRAHMLLLYGNILDEKGASDDAITAWTDGAALAGDLDLTPMMSAVTKLGALAKKAADNHDDAKATAYRSKADSLLQSLADRAKDDEPLARTLGAAYLGAGDPIKAETFLRRAVDLQANDIDAHVELAKALDKQGRTDDALAQLTAAQALAPARADIALELARTYEDANRTSDAAAAYAKLLAAKDVTVQSRVRAGRFLARTGGVKAAAAQADPILAAEPDNPAGHYLRGEGMILAGKLDDARKELTLAVDGDPDPQYLDALGRAAEASAAADSKYQDLALNSYRHAHELAPTMFNPNAGIGRISVARRQWSAALQPLIDANKIDPTNSDVVFDIGLTYKNMGQDAGAIKWLSAVPKKNATTYWMLGMLYRDANNSSAIPNLADATRLGLEEEKAGATLDWLTDAFYTLGELHEMAHDDAAARSAWQHFVDRNPKPSAELTEAKRALNGELRR